MTITDADGREWVLVPKDGDWNMTKAALALITSSNINTGDLKIGTLAAAFENAIAAAPQFVPPAVTDSVSLRVTLAAHAIKTEPEGRTWITAVQQVLGPQLGLSLPITSGIQLHPATAQLVHNFARALAEKLSRAEQKYGYSDNWTKNNWMDECRHKLVEHVGKGDPLDVAAYAAFLWSHGARTSMDVLLDYLEALVTREELARAVEAALKEGLGTEDREMAATEG